MNGLSHDQVAVLLAPIAAHRVKTLDQGPSQGSAYLAQHDVRAHLTRVFGFCGWSLAESVHLVFEERDGIDGATVKVGRDQDPGVRVCYRSHARLTIHGDGYTAFNVVYEGSGTGSATMGVNARDQAHDSAVKSAASDALKRAAISLGDQFGLGLYNLGRSWQPGKPIPAFVRKVVGHATDDTTDTHPGDVEVNDEGNA